MYNIAVAPFAGAWIEIIITMLKKYGSMKSLPSRERGLKFPKVLCLQGSVDVAPFAGAWIEIGKYRAVISPRQVAPFAGAWIEIVRMRVSW